MPTYSYECPNDGCNAEENEFFHKLDEEGPRCPECDVPMVKKLCAPAFQLKGGGWYKDGYASTKKENPKSICAKEFGAGLMDAAREGAKVGGHQEGERRVKEYQDKIARTSQD